jgi:hypothetical protein
MNIKRISHTSIDIYLMHPWTHTNTNTDAQTHVDARRVTAFICPSGKHKHMPDVLALTVLMGTRIHPYLTPTHVSSLSSSLPPSLCIYTYAIHTHMHTHTHIYIYIYMHTYTHIQRQTYTHIKTHIYTHAFKFQVAVVFLVVLLMHLLEIFVHRDSKDGLQDIAHSEVSMVCPCTHIVHAHTHAHYMLTVCMLTHMTCYIA